MATFKKIAKKKVVYTVELSQTEVLGIVKIIGNTSDSDRIKKFECTGEESDVVGELYDVFVIQLRKDNFKI